MIRRSNGPAIVENDMTPMIDVTFQLITFFMFVLNFSEAEQDERIQLPSSQLAKPAEGVVEAPITMQLMANGGVLYAGEIIPVDEIGGSLQRERDIIVASDKDPKRATVIVRADGRANAELCPAISQTFPSTHRCQVRDAVGPRFLCRLQPL